MAKTLRVRTKNGWVTKPTGVLPQNALTSGEIDDNFLALEEQIEAIDFNVESTRTELLAARDEAVEAKTEIRNRYYGPLSEDPISRPDGTAMQDGDEYHNTVTGDRMVFRGGTWGAMSEKLAADLANATDPAKGAGMIGFYPAGAGSIGRTLLDKVREQVSVMDFGAVGDGVTDDTSAIQAACDSGAAGIYFPRGVYKVTSSIVLYSDVKLFGYGGREYSVKTRIENNTNDEYMFMFSSTTNQRELVVEGLALKANNIIDIRPTNLTQQGQHKLQARHVRFSSNSNDYGIAVNIGRTDFSSLVDCSLIGFKGLCAVRIAGNLDDSGSGTPSTSWVATDVTIQRTTFGKQGLISISAEGVKSFRVSDCDMAGNASVSIDLGGFIYNSLARVSSKWPVAGTFYNRADSTNGGPNEFNFLGSPMVGSGVLVAAHIVDNRVEVADGAKGLYAKGFGNNMHGITVRGNEFNSGGASHVLASDFVRFERVRAFNAAFNTVFLEQSTTARGFVYGSTVNMRLVLNDVYQSDVAPTANELAYTDIGGNISPYILRGCDGGKMNTAALPSFNVLNAETIGVNTVDANMIDMSTQNAGITGRYVPLTSGSVQHAGPVLNGQVLDMFSFNAIAGNNHGGLFMVWANAAALGLTRVGVFASTANGVVQLAGDTSSLFTISLIGTALKYNHTAVTENTRVSIHWVSLSIQAP